MFLTLTRTSRVALVNQCPALFFQVATGAHAALRLLLAMKRADVALLTVNEDSVVHLAARSGDEETIHALTNHRSASRLLSLFVAVNESGMTAANVARFRGFEPYALMLEALRARFGEYDVLLLYSSALLLNALMF